MKRSEFMLFQKDYHTCQYCKESTKFRIEKVASLIKQKDSKLLIVKKEEEKFICVKCNKENYSYTLED